MRVKGKSHNSHLLMYMPKKNRHSVISCSPQYQTWRSYCVVNLGKGSRTHKDKSGFASSRPNNGIRDAQFAAVSIRFHRGKYSFIKEYGDAITRNKWSKSDLSHITLHNLGYWLDEQQWLWSCASLRQKSSRVAKETINKTNNIEKFNDTNGK